MRQFFLKHNFFLTLIQYLSGLKTIVFQYKDSYLLYFVPDGQHICRITFPKIFLFDYCRISSQSATSSQRLNFRPTSWKQETCLKFSLSCSFTLGSLGMVMQATRAWNERLRQSSINRFINKRPYPLPVQSGNRVLFDLLVCLTFPNIA